MLKIAGTQFQLKFSLWIKVVGESSWRNNQKCTIRNEKCENEYFLGNKKTATNIFKNKHFQQIFRQQTNVEKYRNENTPNIYNTGLYWHVDVRIMDIIVS